MSGRAEIGLRTFGSVQNVHKPFGPRQKVLDVWSCSNHLAQTKYAHGHSGSNFKHFWHGPNGLWTFWRKPNVLKGWDMMQGSWAAESVLLSTTKDSFWVSHTT